MQEVVHEELLRYSNHVAIILVQIDFLNNLITKSTWVKFLLQMLNSIEKMQRHYSSEELLNSLSNATIFITEKVPKRMRLIILLEIISKSITTSMIEISIQLCKKFIIKDAVFDNEKLQPVVEMLNACLAQNGHPQVSELVKEIIEKIHKSQSQGTTLLHCFVEFTLFHELAMEVLQNQQSERLYNKRNVPVNRRNRQGSSCRDLEGIKRGLIEHNPDALQWLHEYQQEHTGFNLEEFLKDFNAFHRRLIVRRLMTYAQV